MRRLRVIEGAAAHFSRIIIKRSKFRRKKFDRVLPAYHVAQGIRKTVFTPQQSNLWDGVSVMTARDRRLPVAGWKFTA